MVAELAGVKYRRSMAMMAYTAVSVLLNCICTAVQVQDLEIKQSNGGSQSFAIRCMAFFGVSVTFLYTTRPPC